MKLSTLCYIEDETSYLMMLRNKKKNDVNAGKWIGPGGKFENGESPEECVIRETFEETGEDNRIRRLASYARELSDEDLNTLLKVARNMSR